jgi:hypothetical protein
MKFFKVTTLHTQPEIDEIIMSMSGPEVDHVIKIYSQVSMVEYTDENGLECMYAILNDQYVNILADLYSKYGIKFSIHDLSKDVILDNKIPNKFKNYKMKSVKKEITDLINEYKLNWVSKDDI